MLKSIIEKVALWALGRVGNVRHIGEGNSIVLKDQFGREVRLSVPAPCIELWENGCTCAPDGPMTRLDCPFHYLPTQKAVYVRLK